MEHFPLETCTDCDQNLIRIGSNLYTLHSALTCIKRESKSGINCLQKRLNEAINRNSVEEEASSICDPEVDIKLEPETEPNEPFTCDDPTNFTELCYDENHEQTIADEYSLAMDTNTTTAQQMDIKMEVHAEHADLQFAQFIPVDVSNSTGSSDMDLDSSQVCPSKSVSTAKGKSPGTKSKTAYKHKCNVCGKLLQGPAKLELHLKYSHSAPGTVLSRFDCEICHKSFQREGYLRKHMRLMHDSNCEKFRCSFCWYVFFSKKSLNRHQSFRCKHLKKSSKAVSTTTITSAENAGVKKALSAPTDGGNKKSVTKPSKNNKYCEYCDKTFYNKTTCDRHKYQVHKLGGHHCDHCKNVFRTAEGLINHTLKCDRLLNRTWECYICHTAGNYKKNLITHMSLKHVAKDKKFKCSVCKRGFQFKSQCEDHHRRQHMNVYIQTWICSVCGLEFKTKQGFHDHENVHTGNTPYNCKIEGCNRTFRSHSAKYEHERMHGRKKRYQCGINGCTEQFGAKIAFNKHKLNAHGIPIPK